MRTDHVLDMTEALQPSVGRERSFSSDLVGVEPEATASHAAPNAAAATGIMEEEEDEDDTGQV